MSEPPFTALDVLYRAYTIVASGSLKDDEHGPMCVWCAIAQAKSELDKIHDVPMPPFWDRLSPSDMPLVEARSCLRAWEGVDMAMLTQEEAKSILDQASVLVIG